MIPPIPPTPPQTGAPPPLGAPPPMAPPMGAPMPPMPPSPMGKGLGSMLNTDPMARSDFSMMLSSIQNQSMIPPMPMHMNEGGLVGFIQNLLKGIGGIFRGGGGQGSSGGMSFGDAFAKARREGKKVFEYNGKMFTTELKEEQVARLAEEEAKRKPEKYTGPTIPAMEDPYDEVQQSRRDTPKFGNEFDVQGANKDSEAFANRLEQIKKEIERENYRRDVSERAGPEKLLEMMAQQSKAPTPSFANDAIEDMDDIAFQIQEEVYRPDIGSRTEIEFDERFKGNNIVDVIQDRLEKLINVSGDQPEVPPALDRRMMSNTPKFDTNTDIGELANVFNFPPNTTIGDDLGGKNLPTLGEKLQSLLQGLKDMGLSKKLSDSISEKLKILGMTEGGNPMVEKLKAMIAESSNPQKQLQELVEYFTGDSTKDEDNKQILEAIAIIQQSPEFMKEATRSSLLGTMPPQPKELVSDNVRGGKFAFQRDFLEAIKNLPTDKKLTLAVQQARTDMSPLEATKDFFKGMGLRKTPNYIFTPEVKELLGLSNGGSVTDAIARLEKGRQIVNKNEGGAINASNLGMAQGMGMGSGDNIQRLLYPLTTQIHRSYMQENDSEIKKKLDEFTQQVDQLTKSTFPDVSFQNQNTGLGSMPQIGFGGVPTGTRQFGVFRNALEFKDSNASSNPFQNFVRTSDVKPNNINSLASSPFGNSLGSFFQDKFQSLQGYNTGGVVFDNLRDASIGSQIGDVVIVDGKSYIKSVGDGSATGTTFLKPIDTTEPDLGTTGQQAPAFLPGQQGDSPFAGTNLPSESLVNETATEVEDEPVKVFSNVGRQGQGQGYQTIQDVIKDVGGATGTVERLYFKDPETGRVFNYDYDDKEFEGLGPGYYGKGLSDLQLISGISKNRNDENVSFQVDDPSKYDVSGVLGYDPETTEAMAIEQAKDDKSDNDIFYTAPNGQTYVDTTGTGESIPVGSYNIVRGNEALSQYYSVDEEGNRIGNTVGSGQNFVQPALTKTETGYVATGSDKDPFEKNEDGVVSQESIQNHLTGDSFNIGGLEFTSPPSNQINLEPFFNAVESSGGLNQFLYSQQDKLPGFLKFLGIGDGTLPEGYGYSDLKYNDDGSLDLTDLTNKFNEYLSGQDNEGNTSDLFGNTFQQTTDSNMIGSSGTGDISNTGNGSGGGGNGGGGGGGNGGDGGGNGGDGGDETTPKTLFNFKDLYTNTEPMEDIIARTVVDSPVSSEGMGTFSPINSSVVNNPDMFTDFSFPDPSDMTIRDNENPFQDDNRGNVDPSIPPIRVPDQQTNTANMNMGGMPNNGDVISKFLAMDIDKRPVSKTPKVADMSTLTASIKMNEGGEVTAGMNKAIDTFLASMM